ncbi:MAG: HAD family hydrolase [Candidatus Aenigmarchaeota archaeon]|nr:HAD family hydrolase [Candidatus Aenigmarchaeota archaeon]
MITTIMIDYDNTLHDSDYKFITKFSEIFDDVSGEQLWEVYLFKVHRGIVHVRYPERHEDGEFHTKLIFEHLNKPYETSKAKQMIEAYNSALKECWENPSFFPDTFEFLDKVAGKYKVCLATQEFAKEKAVCLEKIGGKKYFDYVLGDHNIRFHKTTSEFYKQALELSKSVAEETVNVGDALTHDILPAKLAGIKTIWVNRKNEVVLEKIKPDYEVKNLLEVLNFL